MIGKSNPAKANNQNFSGEIYLEIVEMSKPMMTI